MYTVSSLIGHLRGLFDDYEEHFINYFICNFISRKIIYSAFVLVASQKILVYLQENPNKLKQLAVVTWYTSCKIISVLKEKEAIV